MGGPAVPVARPRTVTARVELNRPVVPGTFEVTLALPPDWGPARPGQFVQLECPPPELFGLRRPFSLAGCRAVLGGVEARIVYGAVGMRTHGLAQARPGVRLLLTGPLGRPFEPMPERRAVVLGGGRGLAPVLMLAEHLGRSAHVVRHADRTVGSGLAGVAVPGAGSGAGNEAGNGAGNEAGNEAGSGAAVLLHGARTASQLIPMPDPPCEVRLATDDGSTGFHGTLVDLLQSMLDTGELREGRDALYACGPNRMLAVLAEWSAERDLPCQVSLETHFGCGLGMCAGCAVPVKTTTGTEVSAFERFVFLCREGPVMDARRVEWAGMHE
jgi:dihydroorotate dehydrogenase electron transfer subunit